jgi:cysteine desulfurase
MKKIYLDYASTTPVDLRVMKAMLPYFRKSFGNAGSLHFIGQQASVALDESRELISRTIGADFRELIFTSSATEANNLVLQGITNWYLNIQKLLAHQLFLPPRIIVSSIEHDSILQTAKALEERGVEVFYLPVNRDGVVNIKRLEELLNERTILVSIMYANNEIGVIEPISKISVIINNFRNSFSNQDKFKNQPTFSKRLFPLFHTDAAQAFQYLDCNIKNLGVDLMTISAHKIYGPKGIGALYIKNLESLIISWLRDSNINIRLKFCIAPLIIGGGQEFGLRSGTENVPLIVGFAKAVQLVNQLKRREIQRVENLRNYFWRQLKKIYPKVLLNGPDFDKRLVNNLNIYFPKQKSSDLLIKLDLSGIAVSAGAACSARKLEPSFVLKSCGFSKKRIESSLRITLGRYSTKIEIEEALKRMKVIFRNM